MRQYSGDVLEVIHENSIIGNSSKLRVRFGRAGAGAVADCSGCVRVDYDPTILATSTALSLRAEAFRRSSTGVSRGT